LTRRLLGTADGLYGYQTYIYDAVGNRSSLAVTQNAVLTTDTYSYPAGNNRLSSVATGGGHTRTFTYDTAGNTTYDQRTAVDGYGFTYNAANRMATITKNGVVQAEYKYNAQGQQVVGGIRMG
jgi:YD repeat-containing protein